MLRSPVSRRRRLGAPSNLPARPAPRARWQAHPVAAAPALATAALALATTALALVAASAAPVAATEPTEPLRHETTVYVPYDALEGALGAERRGVVIPYEELLELWGAAHPDTPAPEEPPVAATLSRARYQGRVSGDVLLLEGTLDLDGLRDGWALVPLDLDGVAVTSAEPAAVHRTPSGDDQRDPGAQSADGGRDDAPPRALLTRSADGLAAIVPGPGRHRLVLELAAPVTSREGRRTIDVRLPSAAVTDVVVDAGEAVTPEPGSTPTTRLDDGRLRILGEDGHVSLAWLARTEEHAQVPVLFAESATAVTAGEGFARSRTTVRYTVLDAPPRELAFAVPEGAQLLDVRGAAVERFVLDDAASGGDRTLRLELFEPASSGLEVTIEVERKHDTGAAVEAPLVAPRGIARERGWIALARDTDLAIEARATDGLSRVGRGELPPPLSAGDHDWLGAYRFLDRPVRLALAVHRLEPEVRTFVATELRIGDEEVEAIHRVTFHVARAGLFQVQLALPEGFEVRAVTGADGLVESHRRRGATLEVDLGRKLLGAETLTIEGRLPRGGLTEDVRSPLVGTGATREEGVIAVRAVDRLELHTVASDGLRPLSPAGFVEELGARGLAPLVAEPPQLAFRLAEAAATLVVGTELRKTRVTARVGLTFDVEEDRVEARTRVHHEILHAGIDRLALRVPEAIAEGLEIDGAHLKAVTREPAEDGRVVVRVALDQRVLGDHRLDLRFSVPRAEPPAGLEAGGPGRSGQVALPVVEVLDVEREQGFVTLTKRSNLEVEPAPSGLEVVDPEEVPADLVAAGGDPAPGRTGVFAAFRYVGQPWALSLGVARHELEDVLNVIVNRALLRSVVSPERVAVHELTLEVQANQRQYLELALPGGAEILSLLVDGQAERPSLRRSDGVTLVPLARASEQLAPFAVRLFFRTRGERSAMGRWLGRIELEAPRPVAAPVQRFEWHLWAPDVHRYLAPGGDVPPYGPYEPGVFDRVGAAVDALPSLASPPITGVAVHHDTARLAPDGDTAPSPEALAVRLVEEGREFRFMKTGGVGHVSLGYLDRRLAALLVLVAGVAPLVLVARRPVARRGRTLGVLATIVVLALVLTVGLVHDAAAAGLVGTVIAALATALHRVRRAAAVR